MLVKEEILSFFSIKRQSDRQVSPDPFDFGDPYNVRFFTLTEPEASQRPELLLGILQIPTVLSDKQIYHDINRTCSYHPV